jgi:hypothetical protein
MGAGQRQTYYNDGNVGIGITSPDSKLHIYGGRIKLGNIGTGFASGLGIYSGPDATNGYVWMDFTSTNVFTIQGGNASDNATTPIVLQNLGGKVGIGTTLPNEKLEVAGNIRQSGRTTYLFGAGSNENQALMFAGWDFGQSSNADPIWMARYNTNFDQSELRINIGDDGNDRLVIGDHYFADNFNWKPSVSITSSGQMGVNTTIIPDGYKLAVGGNIIAEKVKVQLQTNWSDYVFYPDYKLPSLKEVEEFVKRNKHLPDIPSAKEVETNGIDLGDNQALLLKKIEELTLYIIDINKKVEKLSSENEALKMKVSASSVK